MRCRYKRYNLDMAYFMVRPRRLVRRSEYMYANSGQPERGTKRLVRLYQAGLGAEPKPKPSKFQEYCNV